MTPDPKMSGESFDRPGRAEAERIVREEWRPYNLGEIVSLHMEADLESALIKAREEGRAEAMESAIQKCRAVQKECGGFPSVNALDQALGAFRCVSALEESLSENTEPTGEDQTKGKGE